MLNFMLRRLLWMIPSFFAVSLVAFTIIQLPPGDFVTSYAADLATSGSPADAEHAATSCAVRYGLDQPLPMQYLRWIGNALHGDLGVSFEYRAPVADIIWNRLGMTALVAFCTLLLRVARRVSDRHLSRRCASTASATISSPSSASSAWRRRISCSRSSSCTSRSCFWAIRSAGCSRRNSSMPPWSPKRMLDLLQHLWIPVVVLGVAGIAALVRIMRANLLDELSKPYVETGRAKGLAEIAADAALPDAGRAQPVRQHGRLGAAGPGLRRGHRLERPQPADRRADPDPGLEDPGHVSRPARSSCSSASWC